MSTLGGRRRFADKAAVKRFVACMVGGLILALMVGNQEGSANDYGAEFRKSIFNVRVVVFLIIGVAVFLVITFAPALAPYVARPGFWPFFSGLLAVVAGRFLMHWFDPQGTGKFGDVASAVAQTPSLGALTRAYFSWLWLVALVVVLAAGVAALITRRLPVGIVTAVVAVFAAVVSFTSHSAVVDVAKKTDHSLGYAACVIGYVVAAAGALTAVMTPASADRSRRFLATVLGFRPGLALAVVGLVVGVLGVTVGHWFSPSNKNTTLSETSTLFQGQGLGALASSFLAWLAYALLVVAALAALVATLMRQAVVGLIAAIVGAAGVVICLIALYDISQIGGKQGFDGSTGPWQNLGTGGWILCAGFFLIGGAGLVVVLPERRRSGSGDRTARVRNSDRSARLASTPGALSSFVFIAVAVALFYPPTATPGWQTIIVGEIGLSMFLALGLNVVVGWAGLLDLGFIAFYAIGSYTTAYLVGALPIQPPSWLHLTPLLAIPFAIVICLIAGLLLGAPTLRLRGDYLAIVTLGFGEIIHLIALNAQSVTNGSEGPPKPVPHPSIHIGALHIQWGLNKLQYWYLLLVFVGIIVLLFRRLEGSRIGRAWAAIREDEIAAAANGINPTRVKLLAFAIGASTSGIAGVFNASLVGSFAPDNFLLNNSILIVAYVVFGGMGSLTGAMAGAALLTWLPRFLQDQVPQADQYMWIGGVIILMMIFRPGGLIPAQRRKAELSHFEQPASAEPRAVPVSEGV